jgi:hypothetical protein
MQRRDFLKLYTAGVILPSVVPLNWLLPAGVTDSEIFVVQPVMQFWFPLSNDAHRRVNGMPTCS